MSWDVYRKRRYLVAFGEWTPILVPMDCNFMGMRHAGAESGVAGDLGAITIQTGEAEALDDLQPGQQDGVILHFVPYVGRKTRFMKGEQLAQVQSATAQTQILVVTWVR